MLRRRVRLWWEWYDLQISEVRMSATYHIQWRLSLGTFCLKTAVEKKKRDSFSFSERTTCNIHKQWVLILWETGRDKCMSPCQCNEISYFCPPPSFMDLYLNFNTYMFHLYLGLSIFSIWSCTTCFSSIFKKVQIIWIYHKKSQYGLPESVICIEHVS